MNGIFQFIAGTRTHSLKKSSKPEMWTRKRHAGLRSLDSDQAIMPRPIRDLFRAFDYIAKT